jgi:shikimate dehydrogenase
VAEIAGTTTLVGLIGDPVAGSLSPRMHNAAFAARGLDWAYVPLHVEHASLDVAVGGLMALGFAGANVTTPHKASVIPFCDELDETAERSASVNTLVIDHGRVLGSSTDARALDAVDARSAAVVGAGGAAAAWIAALEAREISVDAFSRRGRWPPETSGADLVVHATTVKDELLFEPWPGQTVVELAYLPDGSETALVAAARAAGCTVIDGLEVLVRQGAASFERWTGVPAPLDVMRAAIRP